MWRYGLTDGGRMVDVPLRDAGGRPKGHARAAPADTTNISSARWRSNDCCLLPDHLIVLGSCVEAARARDTCVSPLDERGGSTRLRLLLKRDRQDESIALSFASRYICRCAWRTAPLICRMNLEWCSMGSQAITKAGWEMPYDTSGKS